MTAAEGETPTQQLTVGITSGSSTPSQTFTTLSTSLLFWQDWGPNSYNFLATATSATLQFSVTNQKYDIGLDAVSVSAAPLTAASAAPLPAALPLFASGLGVMGFLGWRRKRKAQAIAA